MSSKAELRMGQFKNRGALRPEELRRRREDAALVLRKQKREESIAKRRFSNMSSSSTATGSTDGNAARGVPSTIDELSFKEISSFAGQLLSSDDPEFQLSATRAVRKMLSQETSPPIKDVIDYNLVPLFVKFLLAPNPELQFEAAWALTNVASGSTQDTLVVANSGAVEIFVTLLSNPNQDLCEQAVWALGNIAGDCPASRDQVLMAGALPPLLTILQTPHLKSAMIRNAAWTLCNFCRGKKPMVDFQVISPALPVLAQLIHSDDPDVIIDACWALSYLTDGDNDRIEAVIQTGVPARLVALLRHSFTTVQTPALRTVGNIVTGTDVQTQIIINCGVLPCLLDLLMSPKLNIVKEACWTISNITAGTVDQILAVIQADIFPMVINFFSHAEFKVKREICWAISNATNGGLHDTSIITYLVERGCIRPLVDVLSCEDVKVIRCALEGLSNILEVGSIMSQDGNVMLKYIEEAGGVPMINSLQYHSNKDIYTCAAAITDKYFPSDHDDADMNVLADDIAPSGEFSFKGDSMDAPSGGFTF